MIKCLKIRADAAARASMNVPIRSIVANMQRRGSPLCVYAVLFLYRRSKRDQEYGNQCGAKASYIGSRCIYIAIATGCFVDPVLGFFLTVI